LEIRDIRALKKKLTDHKLMKKMIVKDLEEAE